MNEMVERVMRSLYEHWRQHYGVEGAFEKLAPTELEFGEKQARAAIAAMRVPTEAMARCSVNAGWSGVIEGDPELERERGVYLYQDMIDAALEDDHA